MGTRNPTGMSVCLVLYPPKFAGTDLAQNGGFFLDPASNPPVAILTNGSMSCPVAPAFLAMNKRRFVRAKPTGHPPSPILARSSSPPSVAGRQTRGKIAESLS